MRMSKAAATIAVLVGFGACAPNMAENGPNGGGVVEGLQLQVDRSVASPGGEIRITLTNGSNAQVGYNLCVASLERLMGGEWAAVPESPAEVCTMELRTLAPGGTDRFTHTVPSGLGAGTYRFATRVEAPLGGGMVTVRSGRFEIAR
jgi:hypothetical protein